MKHATPAIALSIALMFAAGCKDDSLCGGSEYNSDKQFCYQFAVECKCDCAAITEDKAEVLDKCGGKKYDYKKQLCQDGTIKERLCGGKEYDPYWQFCHNDIVFEKCAGKDVYNPDTHYCGETCTEDCGSCSFDTEGVMEL